LTDPPLGTELRECRLERGWTQEELAARVGAGSGVVVSAWENNYNGPNDEHAARLVELFGLVEYGGSYLGLAKRDRSTADRDDDQSGFGTFD
jgi:transcriptional regulator with XRE-family HTH domain